MRLTKERKEALRKCLTQFTAAEAQLQQSVADFNRAITDAWDAVYEDQEAYNERLTELKDSLTGIADELQGDWDNKSERWQDGERGQAASDWIDQLREALDHLDQAELGCPDELEAPEQGPDAETAIDELPEGPQL